MIATAQDLQVLTEEDFDRLPDDGLWEVVDGRAILSPYPDIDHQFVSGEILVILDRQFQASGAGRVLPTLNVFGPPREGSLGEFQNRIPDLVIFKKRPRRRFPIGLPPEWVIEILSTRLGNVERTEKMEDYARTGVPEYWIVSPHSRFVEAYELRQGRYELRERRSVGTLSPSADLFPGIKLPLADVWAVLDSD